MTSDHLHHPIYLRLNPPALMRRHRWLTHRSLDLLLLAGSACLVALMSQPVAAALAQN